MPPGKRWTMRPLSRFLGFLAKMYEKAISRRPGRESTWSPIPPPSSSPLRRDCASSCSRTKRRRNSPLKSLIQAREGLSHICLTSESRHQFVFVFRQVTCLDFQFSLSGPLLSPIKHLLLPVSQIVTLLLANFYMHIA